MSTHTCLRCGYQQRCVHGAWWDRHPTAAVAFATPTAIIGLATVCTYPWLLAVIVVGFVAYVADREHRRRRALAARADWEHHQLTRERIPAAAPLQGLRIASSNAHSEQPTAPTALTALR